jgi:hypothetical protein
MTLRSQFDRARRRLEERIDQAWTMSWHKFKRQRMGPPFDGEPRFALISVNYSTTRYLKLMLLTLAEQSSLQLLKRIILVDNCSRDGVQVSFENWRSEPIAFPSWKIVGF